MRLEFNKKKYEINKENKKHYYLDICSLGKGGMAEVRLVLDPIRTVQAYMMGKEESRENIEKTEEKVKGRLRKNPSSFDNKWDSFFEPHRRKYLRYSALKVMLPNTQSKTEHRYRFLREAYLGHLASQKDRKTEKSGKHIVMHHDSNADEFYPVFEYSQTMTDKKKDMNIDIDTLEIPSNLFINMMFINGLLSHKEIRKLGVLPKLDYLIGCCDSLSHIHNLGIIHRDIKFDNFLARNTGRGLEVRLSDFGLARIYNEDSEKDRLNRLTSEDSIMGTVNYMAPEQAEGFFNATKQSDIYSIGVMMFNLFTPNQFPFSGGTVYQILNSITDHSSKAPSPRSYSINFFKKFDPENKLEEMILKSLEKDQSSRYNSVEELKRDLLSYRDFVENKELGRYSGEDSTILKISPEISVDFDADTDVM